MSVSPPAAMEPAARHHALAASLVAHGWAAMPNFVPPEMCIALAAAARQQWQAAGFRQAGVGRGEDFQVRPEIRSDHVRWLDPQTAGLPARFWATELEPLRLAINQAGFLGLHDFEGHFSVYPPGAFYQRHVDQFQGARARVVSLVLYLNEHWQTTDGGALRLYLGNDAGEEQSADILPETGTLVCFLSERIAHEVLATKRERLSFAGWFRVRD